MEYWCLSLLCNKVHSLGDKTKKQKHSGKHGIRNIHIRCIPTKLLLINKSREKLDVTSTTLNLLLKFYRILEDQCSVLVGEFRYFSRNGKVFGIGGCLNTYSIPQNGNKSQDEPTSSYYHFVHIKKQTNRSSPECKVYQLTEILW